MDELLKIKHKLIKERVEKLSEIARLRVLLSYFPLKFSFTLLHSLWIFMSQQMSVFKISTKKKVTHRVQFSNFAKTSTWSCFKNVLKQYNVGLWTCKSVQSKCYTLLSFFLKKLENMGSPINFYVSHKFPWNLTDSLILKLFISFYWSYSAPCLGTKCEYNPKCIMIIVSITKFSNLISSQQ